jgi:hypothetical protein
MWAVAAIRPAGVRQHLRARTGDALLFPVAAFGVFHRFQVPNFDA